MFKVLINEISGLKKRSAFYVVTGVTKCFEGSHADSPEAKRGKLSGKLQNGEATSFKLC